MKKSTLGLAILINAGLLMAQSQRLVFVEEFTQASCGPCASANPAFNALLSSNSTKITSVKYQVSWPGTDPMNAQNPADAANRVSYYGVSGVPDARLQGTVTTGSPGNVTQANIGSQYAIPSQFTIKLDHWLNSAQDSIFVNCEITCSQNITMTTPKLRVALIEKDITFASAPGSNGEKSFYNVMRDMYPTANGSALTTTWTTGQKKVISFKEKLPTYIYKKSEIGVVAWIQDDTDKSVKQSAISSSPSTPLALAPIAEFKADVVTTCDGIVNFSDQSALFPTSWAWHFGDGGASGLQNPVHKYSVSGTYAVQLTSVNANGNNSITKTSYVTVTLTGTAPTGVDGKICSNGVVNLSAATSGSGSLNWYNYNGAMVHTGTTYSPTIIGTTDFWVAEMIPNAILPTGEPDNTIGTGANFTAASTHGLYFDVLKPCELISVVTYGGAAGNRVIEVVDAAGNSVATKTVNIPSGMSTVNLNFKLPAGTGFLIRTPTVPANLYRNDGGASFPYTTGVINITGNTAAGSPAYYYYFYDWRIQQNPCTTPAVKVSGIDTCTSTEINELTVTNSLLIFPNPSSGVFVTSFNTLSVDNYVVKITNTLGQVVYAETLENFSGNYSREMNVSLFGKGVYLLSISNSKNVDVKKIITY